HRGSAAHRRCLRPHSEVARERRARPRDGLTTAERWLRTLADTAAFARAPDVDRPAPRVMDGQGRAEACGKQADRSARGEGPRRAHFGGGASRLRARGLAFFPFRSSAYSREVGRLSARWSFFFGWRPRAMEEYR